jgi:hypothetical protein
MSEVGASSAESAAAAKADRPDTNAHLSPSPAEGWVREAWERVLREVALFARTFAAFALHPMRSARAWQAGERDFMNPIAFGGSAAGLYWGVSAVVGALWPVPGSEASDTLARQLASAVGPYVHYGLLGAAMHVGLRGLGSRRSLLGSLGAAFFTGGSVGTATALLLSSTAGLIAHARGVNTLELGSGDSVAFWFLFASAVSYALVCASMATALMGLGRTAVWKTILAGGFAIVLTAILFGSVIPEGDYGWRPYIHFDAAEKEFGFGFQG